MAFARRVNLFQREIREKPSISGFELLLRAASMISEGQVATGGQYFGSTLLTLDLTPQQEHLRDSCDVATARRLAALLQRDEVALEQLRQIALREARKIARCPLAQLETDIRLRVEGARLLIDIDVEGQASQMATTGGK
jgi:hypothetical protein